MLFYKEYVEPYVPIPYTPPYYIPYTYPPPYTTPIDPIYPPTYTGDPIINPSPTWTICDGFNGDSTYKMSSSGNYHCDVNNMIDGDIPLNGTLNVKGDVNENLKSCSRMKRTRLKETGRIEKGNRTNQYFSQIEFKTGFIIKTYLFKLLPFSEKKEEAYTPPVQNQNPYIIQNQQQSFNNTSYIRSDYREYCSNKRCNYRIRKSNWGFCPMCGTKLD